MGLSDLEATLPNGFHDMRLASIHLDLCTQTTVLEVDILVGLPDDVGEARDEYRRALLHFQGAKVSIIDAPDPSSSYCFPGAASVAISEGEEGGFPERLLVDLPSDLRIYTIYVRDWLANIHVAAASIDMTWGA